MAPAKRDRRHCTAAGIVEATDDRGNVPLGCS